MTTNNVAGVYRFDSSCVPKALSRASGLECPNFRGVGKRGVSCKVHYLDLQLSTAFCNIGDLPHHLKHDCRDIC